MINLSKRLQTVASFIPDNANLIDVGCDHALLDIYLYQTKKNIQILATDINIKPLEQASNNLKKYNLENKIILKQMNGIEELKEDIDTIVIAGMGGILITDLLNKPEKLQNIKTIVVAPNNDFPLVRQKIIKLGYKISQEKIIIDKKKIYVVIKFIKGKQEKIDYLFGTLTKEDLISFYYYTNILNTNLQILKKLPLKYFFKRTKIKLENKKIRKFLK